MSESETRTEIGPAEALALILFVPTLLCFLLIPPAEKWYEFQCRQHLREVGVAEPADWPNCHNVEGRKIMRARYFPEDAA